MLIRLLTHIFQSFPALHQVVSFNTQNPAIIQSFLINTTFGL